MKKLLFLTLVLCLFIILASCSKPRVAVENEKATKTEQTTENKEANEQLIPIVPGITTKDQGDEFLNYYSEKILPELIKKYGDKFMPVFFDPEIKATDLVADFEEDETKALSTYKGKIYDITGVIEEIGSDLLDRPFVTLGKEGGVGLEGGALCKFDITKSDEISKLNVGDTITIRGKIDSFLLKVTVTDCELVLQEK
jgi:hypothetical protein